MRVLITGASGFIGAHVLNNLIVDSKDHEILSLGREFSLNSQVNLSNVYWENFDLSNPETCFRRVKEFQPEVVIHLAWEGIPDFSLDKSSKNLLNSINFLSYVLSLESCKKVIVSGSCFEYGRKLGSCNESDRTEAKDYFTWSKLSLLEYLKVECEMLKKKFAWLRVFYAYGPNQRQDSLIPMLIKSLKDKEIPNIRTPLNANDFIYVGDVAEAFNMCVNKDFKSGIYNLGTGSMISVLEVCSTVEDLLHGNNSLSDKLSKSSFGTKQDTAFYASTYLSDQELNWKAKTKLYEGIANTLSES